MMRDSVQTFRQTRAATGEDVLVDMGGGITGSVPIETLASQAAELPAFAEALKKAATAATSSAAQSRRRPTWTCACQKKSRPNWPIWNAATEAADAAAGQANQVPADGARAPGGGGLARAIVAVGVLGYWDATQAARCVYWMALNGGTGGAPTFPTNINDYLVVGDRVGALHRHGPGHVHGLAPVARRPQSDGGHAAQHVIPRRHQPGRVLGQRGNGHPGVRPGVRVGHDHGHWAHTDPARRQHSPRRTSRTPISWRAPPGSLAALDADIASWAILACSTVRSAQGYRTPMPTAFLVYGDTVTFIERQHFDNIGALSWNGSAWT